MGRRNPKDRVYQTTRARTRTQKPKLSDPADNTAALSHQLSALGLYAAPTLGDGNCLFRALSDQLYGSPNHHLELRKEICKWMEDRKHYYEGFVEDDRGIDTHLRCMRTPGTYGGHLELSAFAHLKRRNVKVIQPGLVYVIEWFPPPTDPTPPTSSAPMEDPALNDREKRRLRREKKKEAKVTPPSSDNEAPSAIYVAYHDWEHFSSVRNLRGPHAGLPAVVESTMGDIIDIEPPSRKNSRRTQPTTKLIKSKGKAKQKADPVPIHTPLKPPLLGEPTDIPLPRSRSSSPTATSSSALSVPSIASTQSSLVAPDVPTLNFTRLSPKRRIEDSLDAIDSEADGSQDGRRTRRKPHPAPPSSHFTDQSPAPDDIDIGDDRSSSSEHTASSSAHSSSASELPTTVSTSHSQPPTSKPLTRRERKALGLPKPRLQSNLGKIVIPGGRHPTRVVGTDDTGKWVRNGSGRVDMRGFKELKI